MTPRDLKASNKRNKKPKASPKLKRKKSFDFLSL